MQVEEKKHAIQELEEERDQMETSQRLGKRFWGYTPTMRIQKKRALCWVGIHAFF